jgi:hypothetical protein
MTRKNWIAIASAEHVRIGRAQGFMQVCHGRATPLHRLSPGDTVAYYSPTKMFRGKDQLQAFTAIGIVSPRAPYQADMGGGFRPFRREVQWREALVTPVRPLLGQLAFARDNKNWGYQLRFGLLEIANEDMRIVASAMRADLKDHLQ